MDILIAAYAPAHNKLRVSQIQEQAEAFGLDMKEAVRMRLRYLYRLKRSLEEMITTAVGSADGVMIEAAFRLMHQRDEISREIRRTAEWWKKPPAGSITDDMIAAAKAYPIERLVDFSREGKAEAWCHQDKRPSLSWHRKANRAHCFPCNQSFNPVDVLMTRDGMTFVDAVKALQ